MNALRRLPATVWLLGLVSFCNDAASDLVYPLLPLYLAGVLGAGPQALGLIEGVAEALASLLKLVSGVLADHYGSARPWVIGGYGLAALARPAIALAASWPVVLLLRVTDRIGKGLRSAPRDALLARSVAVENRGLAFGLHRAMDNAGAVAGPLAAWALLGAGMSVRDLLLWTLLPGLVTVALTCAVREPAPAAVAPAATAFDWRPGDFPPVFRRYLVVLGLFTLGNSSNMFLLLRARELGLPEAQVPLLWGLTSVMAMLFSTPLSALSDRFGRRRLLLAGWGLYAVCYAAFGLLGAGASGLLWPLFAAYGLSLAATEGTEKALVADLAPPERLGAAYGWFNLVVGALLLPASLLFGLLWAAFGAPVAFGAGAGCALAAAGLFAGWVGRVPARAAPGDRVSHPA